MQAKKCDRCGKLYEIDPKTKNDDKLKLVRLKETRAKNLYRRSFDLCPQCEDSLEKWFDKVGL